MMKRLCFYLIMIVLSIGVANPVHGQKLSARSQKVQAAYKEYKSHPTSGIYRLNYIDEFPGSGRDFIDAFSPVGYGQLYDVSQDYIFSFLELADYYPADIINKSIDIGKDLTWDADAISFLQVGIVNLGNGHPQIFIKKMKSLNAKDRLRLITFIADVENHDAYPAYKDLIKLMKLNGAKILADQLTDAMNKRMKTPND